jgi:AcrR family transcriptional regulator
MFSRFLLPKEKFMAKRTYEPNAKQRILDAAKAVFAEKGFDGARVDEIAKTAKVPKSLIYYHFSSKDEILETLLNGCLEQYREILTDVNTNMLAPGERTISEQIHKFYLKFLEEQTDLLRIMSMELLKKQSSKAHLAFRFAEMLVEVEDQAFPGSMGFSPEERVARMVTEFFTGQLPIVIFMCLRESWAKFFDIEPATLSQQFMDAYETTYGVYYKQKRAGWEKLSS